MKRYSNISSPLAVLLLVCFFHCAAAARLLPAVPPLVHQENGVEATAGVLVLQEGAAGNGVALPDSEMTGAEEEEAAACEERSDECMQKRLLRDAHLDYIYTQHKGKP